MHKDSDYHAEINIIIQHLLVYGRNGQFVSKFAKKRYLMKKSFQFMIEELLVSHIKLIFVGSHRA